jgi:hypothetical protein
VPPIWALVFLFGWLEDEFGRVCSLSLIPHFLSRFTLLVPYVSPSDFRWFKPQPLPRFAVSIGDPERLDYTLMKQQKNQAHRKNGNYNFVLSDLIRQFRKPTLSSPCDFSAAFRGTRQCLLHRCSGWTTPRGGRRASRVRCKPRFLVSVKRHMQHFLYLICTE